MPGRDEDKPPTYPPEEPPSSSGLVTFDEPVHEAPTSRYETLAVLGKGAMGEVLRVRDRDLNRVVALKALRKDVDGDARVRDRFVAEAQITAQLEHPGVVPVHEFGLLPDRRFFFTMKEVKGQTLRSAISALHEPRQGPAVGGWTLTRAIDTFRRVCEAMAYAHSRGVVHRDLKPDNVMIGEFGEVLVLDWGLSKALGRAFGEQTPVVSTRMPGGPMGTLPGTVAGTPSYMPPEQAAGRFDDVGPTADVYALGAILYEILVGLPPYEEEDALATITRVLAGPPDRPLPNSFAWGMMSRIDLPESSGPAVPVELVRICRRAMERDPADRYPDARPMAMDVNAWLDGSQRKMQAREKIAEAEALYPEIHRLKGRAAEFGRDARRRLREVPAWAPVEEKRPAWELESLAADAEREASIVETRYLELLQAALGLSPDLDEAHQRLANWYRKRHEHAERMGQGALVGRYEALLRTHDVGEHAEYLDGRGRLVLLTSPSDATVTAAATWVQARRVVAGRATNLGQAPLVSVRVPWGSSVLTLRAPGHADVTYPIHLRRLDQWDGIRPGEFAPHVIPLPPVGALGADDCYVPAGRFVAGEGEPGADRPRPWVDGFVIRRHPVTFHEYLEYLDDLAHTAGDEAALRHAPATPDDGAVEVLVDRDENGRHRLRGALRGARLDWPVTLVRWTDAMAYAAWYGARTGLPWRLPGDLEWEKAARGVDGRAHPWGDLFDPAFCNMAQSHPQGGRPVSVDAFATDESPYGVRGMAGNVAELCLDAFEGARVDAHGLALPPDPGDPTAARVERGGSWITTERACRVGTRRPVPADRRSPGLGFRLARSWPS